MKPHQLISSASYGPEELDVLFKAFDQAWAAVAADVGDDPMAIEATRLKLANIILGLARNGNRDPERLKDAALQFLGAVGKR